MLSPVSLGVCGWNPANPVTRSGLSIIPRSLFWTFPYWVLTLLKCSDLNSVHSYSFCRGFYLNSNYHHHHHYYYFIHGVRGFPKGNRGIAILGRRREENMGDIYGKVLGVRLRGDTLHRCSHTVGENVVKQQHLYIYSHSLSTLWGAFSGQLIFWRCFTKFL